MWLWLCPADAEAKEVKLYDDYDGDLVTSETVDFWWSEADAVATIFLESREVCYPLLMFQLEHRHCDFAQRIADSTRA